MMFESESLTFHTRWNDAQFIIDNNYDYYVVAMLFVRARVV